MAAVDFVSDLKPFKSTWKIRVKIVRMWKQYSGVVGETIEMVVVDSKGDKIHATVKKDQVSQFQPFISEGDSKLIVNFAVTQSTGSYRTTSHPYRVVFLSTTRVRVCENLPIQLSGLSPVPFKAIMDGTQDPDYLVDVIRQIVEVTQIEVVSVNGKDTKKLALELRNHNDDRLPIVLWGNFATYVNEAIQTRGQHEVICVLRFGKIKIWKEERSLSNAYNVSDVSLDSDLIEVEDFRALLPKDDLTIAISDSKPLAPVNGVSEKDDFFIHTPRKTIAEVLASRQVEKCIVICKTCSKKVLTVPNDTLDDGIDGNVCGHTYFCVKCNSYSPTLLPRYKLHIVVLDNSTNTKFLLFDNLALQLLHQQCVELTGPITNEIQEPEVIPAAINNLVGKTYLFKIGIERENYLYKHPTFKVLKIITNSDMITEFDVSHSPTGSMMVGGSSSRPSVSKDRTPAKRIGAPIINLEDSFDQNSVTRTSCPVKIKKEKLDESG
ncbi:hypothetical protein N665_0776s0008 [Sinapis alba]|nr:hypothetical protein N665_0776s0008 [Sinapis alba]